MSAFRRALLVAALSLAACASKPAAHPVATCPDAPIFPCLTPNVCEYDPVRRCETCRCAPPPYVPHQDQRPPSERR